MFWVAKGGILQAERPPFAVQKAAFWKPGGIILICRMLQRGFLYASGKAVFHGKFTSECP